MWQEVLLVVAGLSLSQAALPLREYRHHSTDICSVISKLFSVILELKSAKVSLQYNIHKIIIQ
jgi:hypothetical protein